MTMRGGDICCCEKWVCCDICVCAYVYIALLFQIVISLARYARVFRHIYRGLSGSLCTLIGCELQIQ